jgi:aminobenzoyl-glutamate transport protein
VTTRLVEGRMGAYDTALAPTGSGDGEVEPVAEVAPEAEARGLAWAGWGTLAALAFITLLTAPPGAPLRAPVTDKIIGDTPFMNSLIVIIMFVFLVAGLCYGRGAGTLTTKDQVLATITKSWSGLAALLFLFLLIAQFIAYFNFSKMPDVAAVKLGDILEHVDVGAVWLLLGVVIISAIVNFIIPAAIAKWALLAPIFVPLFLRLGVPPQTVLAAYRVGDAPTNVITPLMAYFPLIVVFTKRYDRTSGIGTVVSMMLPYVIALSILWTLFFVVWYLLGIPLGPGAPVS